MAEFARDGIRIWFMTVSLSLFLFPLLELSKRKLLMDTIAFCYTRCYSSQRHTGRYIKPWYSRR